MNDKKFMEQKAKDMSVDELIHAIKIKIIQNIKSDDKKIKETLSDMSIPKEETEKGKWYYEEEKLKEANKKFIDYIKNELNYSNRFERIVGDKAKEIYGEKVI